MNLNEVVGEIVERKSGRVVLDLREESVSKQVARRRAPFSAPCRSADILPAKAARMAALPYKANCEALH